MLIKQFYLYFFHAQLYISFFYKFNINKTELYSEINLTYMYFIVRQFRNN